MRKVILISAATFVLVVFGASFAQTLTKVPSAGAQHTVTVRIPNLLAIRFANNSNAPVSNPNVGFNYSASTTTYLNAVASASALPSTDPSPSFTKILVFSNGTSGWQLGVSTAVNTASTTASTAFPATQVQVTPGTPDPAILTYPTAKTAFTLPAAGSGPKVLWGGDTTSGWANLAIGAGSYSILVNGSEAPGTTVLDVTYSFTAP